MITSNLLQSCHRSEILGKFTRASVAKAQEKPLTYFPYEIADEREFDDPEIQKEIRNNFGYRYNKYIIVKYLEQCNNCIFRDAVPNLPPEADDDLRQALKGYNIEIEAHKTAKKGMKEIV